MKTEIYISVKDLIKECIRKIWIIIVAMVVFGILLAGFRYAKDKKNIANTTNHNMIFLMNAPFPILTAHQLP